MVKSVQMGLVGCVVMLLSPSVIAQDFYRGEVGIDYWWASTKVNDIRYEEDKKPYLTFVIESDLPYVPHFKFRYTDVNATHTAFEKADFIFYYDVIEHELLEFNLGINASNFNNSRYTYSGADVSFDTTTWGVYGSGALRVPNTNLDVIGEIDFYDSGNKKTADFTAGFEYTFYLQEIDLALKTGYRVIDLTFNEEQENEATSFVDGWFLGISVKM